MKTIRVVYDVGGEAREESVEYTSLTTVHGVWQSLQHKRLDQVKRFGLFDSDANFLQPDRTLSYYGNHNVVSVRFWFI
jgi:hypothetical protein